MGFLSILLIILIVFILIILIGGLILFNKARNLTRSLGINDLAHLATMIKESDEEFKVRHKTISGMTDILLPSIMKDFPDFNEAEIYNKVETSLLAIFSSLSQKEVSRSEEHTSELQSR